MEHYLYHYPALIVVFYRFFGHFFLDCLAEVESVGIIDFQNYVKHTQWLEHVEG